MQARKVRFYLSLFAGAVILAINVYGFVLLRSRPGLPREYKAAHVVRLDGFEVKESWDIPFLLVYKSVGDPAILAVEAAGTTKTIETTIVPHYSRSPFLLIYLIVGLFAAAIGAACFVLKYEDLKARIFFWLTLAFVSPVVLGGSFRLARGDHWLSLVPGVLFCVSYAFAMPLLLFFLMAYSSRPHKIVKRLAFSSAAFFSLTLSASFLWATVSCSIGIYRSLYLPLYTAFRVSTLLLMFAAIFYLAFPIKSTRPGETREAFKWIVLGLLLSFVPYAALYQIPSIVTPDWPLVKDEVATLFFIFAPVGFALAIFKHKLIRLELVIKRSLVYSILTVFTVGLYMLSVQVFNGLFVKWLHIRDWTGMATGVLLAAAAFRPAQSRIQKFVDRAFFRQAYDDRLCLKNFAKGAQEIFDRKRLADFFLGTLDGILPLQRAGICVHDKSGESSEITFENGDCAGLRAAESACLESGTILAVRRAVAPSVGADFSHEPRLIAAGWEMTVPLPFKASSLKGILGLGLKKSGQTFSPEDVGLIDGLASEFAIHLERIRLHEEVVIERKSKEELDKLNRLKTEFISSFSHELRTPMSSIQSLAEMLESGKIKDAGRREELIGTISAESGRLSRMIHNILDFGKIERQTKTLSLRTTDIREVVKDAFDVFRHELDSRGFTADWDVPGQPVILLADRDALKQCLINLIDNAMKYSAETKEIGCRLLDEPGRVEIRIWDRGIGIPEDEREKIFKEFYRASQGSRLNPKGVGLGLKIVKHIVDGHKGRIVVEGAPGKGSTFRLIFPKS